MNIYNYNTTFTNNKYTSWYFSIIENAIDKNRKKTKTEYYESHHILPISLFPEFKSERWNIVTLSAREHFVCHWLLVKMTSGKDLYKMYKALHKMTQQCSPKRTITSEQYEIGRKYNSKCMRENNPATRDDVKQKISDAKIGKSPTDKTKLKMSQNNSRYWKGKPNLYKGSKFYNNGIIQKLFFDDCVPYGWVIGRLNSSWNKGLKIGPNKNNKKQKSEQHKINLTLSRNRPFLSIIKNKKTYAKADISRIYPEFKQYY